MQYFQTRFLAEADEFIAGLDPKAAKKVHYKRPMAKKAIKSYSLAEMKDKYIGKADTAEREIYE